MVGGWRRLHNEELHNLYASPNIVRVIKSRRMRRTENVARSGREWNCMQYFGWKTCRERDHSEDLGVDEKIILEWILGN
jgi:hypothetical protein